MTSLAFETVSTSFRDEGGTVAPMYDKRAMAHVGEERRFGESVCILEAYYGVYFRGEELRTTKKHSDRAHVALEVIGLCSAHT